MELNIVPFSAVKAAIDSSTPFNAQDKFNTHEHDIEELKTAAPDVYHQAKPEREQPWLRLGPWLDVIMQSQHIDASNAHQIKLPGWYCDDLIRAGATWQMSHRVNSSDMEDLSDSFPKRTISGRKVDGLFEPSDLDSKPAEIFVRLDACSIKDAETLPSATDAVGGRPIGNVPFTHASQLWQRILTSVRGCRGIKEARAADEDVYIYLLPWREDVVGGIEFRVFCPPPHGHIAAISQYVWHRPLGRPASDSVSLQRWCKQVHAGIKDVHARIMSSTTCTPDMKKAGYTFDVLVFAGEPAEHDLYQSFQNKPVLDLGPLDVQLVELNIFGATTGCGSCLFHWIRDAEVLYGKRQEAESRVALWSDVRSEHGNI